MTIADNINRVQRVLNQHPRPAVAEIAVGDLAALATAFPVPGLESRRGGYFSGFSVELDEGLPRDMWVLKNHQGHVLAVGRFE